MKVNILETYTRVKSNFHRVYTNRVTVKTVTEGMKTFFVVITSHNLSSRGRNGHNTHNIHSPDIPLVLSRVLGDTKFIGEKLPCN